VDAGGVEALVEVIAFGGEQARLRAAESLAYLVLHRSVRDRLGRLDGPVAAVARDWVAVVEDLLLASRDSEDRAAAAVSVLVNACLADPPARERVVKGPAPAELVRGVAAFGCHFAAEAVCLLALLAEPPDNRLALSRVVARSGEAVVGLIPALSAALCAEDAPTDARGAAGARSVRAAAASALCYMAAFGGLEEVVRVVRHGDDSHKVAAAKP
jgi:hypothetical protein